MSEKKALFFAPGNTVRLKTDVHAPVMVVTDVFRGAFHRGHDQTTGKPLEPGEVEWVAVTWWANFEVKSDVIPSSAFVLVKP